MLRNAAAPAIPPASGPPRPTAVATPAQAAVRQQYLDLRASVHRKLLGRLNLEALAHVERAKAEVEIRSLLVQLLSEESAPLSLAERETLFAEVLDDVFGLGPLEPLLRDPTISDILVNTYTNVYVERKGRLERVTATFRDNAHLLRVIDRIVAASAGASTNSPDGRRPSCRRLACQRDHSAAGARWPGDVDSPLRPSRLKAEDLIRTARFPPPMMDFLSHCVQAR